MAEQHMPISALRARDRIQWWAEWGQDGRRAAERDGTLTPSAYYAALFWHMLAGGPILPLLVGPWRFGKAGQIYVFDGHHRFAIASILGWPRVPVSTAGPEYTEAPSNHPVYHRKEAPTP